MKNSIHIKFFILSILIIIPISILYLNLGDELFNNTKENLKNNTITSEEEDEDKFNQLEELNIVDKDNLDGEQFFI